MYVINQVIFHLRILFVNTAPELRSANCEAGFGAYVDPSLSFCFQ